jgi:hypothetical protein
MGKLRFLIVCASILALTLAGAVLAQGAQGIIGSGGAGRPQSPQAGTTGGAGRLYNPQTVTTVKGEVMSVDTYTGRRGYQGVHLTLKTDQETIPVHLGPKQFLDQQTIKFAAGDKVEATGSRVTFDGKPAIIAAEVKTGGQTLKLRDANGIPLWAGQGRRR